MPLFMHRMKYALCLPLSPQIKAASEKLQELREKDLRKSASPNQSGGGIVTGFPSASEEVLDAQRKRFEELKVIVSSLNFLIIIESPISVCT